MEVRLGNRPNGFCWAHCCEALSTELFTVTRSLALELAQPKINVNTIAPGQIRAPRK